MGVTLLFILKLNEFHFCKQNCQVFIVDTYFQKKCNIQSPSLPGSRIVGEEFFKSLSIVLFDYIYISVRLYWCILYIIIVLKICCMFLIVPCICYCM